jgi:excinuclease ABC subunit C
MNDQLLELKNYILEFPKLPGCYLYKDAKGKVLYVGKAKNLFNRIRSYFNNFDRLEVRIQQMMEAAKIVEFIAVDSEVESIILETNLIKKYKPKYNILMRDDKNYTWVMFQKPVKGKNDFPRIRLVREKEFKNAEYFGPYPDRLPLRNILKKIRKVFPYASCERRLIQISSDPLQVDTNNKVPCLYYHIGLCNAPCASFESKEEYMKNFNNIKKFFRGEKTEILDELKVKMDEYSKEFDYENAAIVRDRINDIKYITSQIKIDSNVDEIVVQEMKRSQRENALKDLVERLKFPDDKLKAHTDFRIECYDISNIQGTNPVGAMTVMINGELRPDLYRRFRIMSKETPDDFAMMQEMLERRLKRLRITNDLPALNNVIDSSKRQAGELRENDSFSQKPDLIIVDGGKGQLSSAYLILKDQGLHTEIPMVGLAKREEEIFKINFQFHSEEEIDKMKMSGISKFKRILLPRKSESLYLVQRIRDEAHRFGITYHRKLRSKKMVLMTKDLN